MVNCCEAGEAEPRIVDRLNSWPVGRGDKRGLKGEPETGMFAAGIG